MSFRSGADFLEEVRNLIDIREIISDYLPLKKSGGRYRGLCPFHSEKTPSFYVTPASNSSIVSGVEQEAMRSSS